MKFNIKSSRYLGAAVAAGILVFSVHAASAATNDLTATGPPRPPR